MNKTNDRKYGLSLVDGQKIFYFQTGFFTSFVRDSEKMFKIRNSAKKVIYKRKFYL